MVVADDFRLLCMHAPVRAAHVALSQMMKLAVRSGRLTRNPAEYVPLPRVRRATKRYLTHDEVENLADAAGEHRAAILFLAYTGVRYGDLAATGRSTQPHAPQEAEGK